MTAACTDPVEWASLVAYWASDPTPEEADAVEAHLMGCGRCTVASGRVAAITESLRASIPPLVTAKQLDALRERGLSVEENRMLPGERKEVVFRRGTDLMAHRLGGLDMSRAERVHVRVLVESTRAVLLDNPQAPFDRDTGEVIVACQKHFAAFPPDVLIEVEAVERGATASRATYAIPHRFEVEVPAR